MAIIVGEYSCKHCENKDFNVLGQRKKGTHGTMTVMVLRCKKCREVFDIGATTTYTLTYSQTKNKE